MPTYQYACTSCGERLEVVQKFSDDPLTVCPACAGTLRKVFTPVGVVFKGSGFYKTDSRSSGKSSADAKSAKPADGATAGSGDSASSSPGEASSTTSSTPASESGSGGSGDSAASKAGPKAGGGTPSTDRVA